MRSISLTTNLILIFALAVSILRCGHSTRKAANTDKSTKQGLQFNRSETAIIDFHKNDSWIFDSTYAAATLTQSELETIDSFFDAAVNNYNNALDSKHTGWRIDTESRKYRKQVVAVTNKKGEKEVWVNCFCGVDDNSWKKEIVVVMDGGTCYFQFKINLTTNKYYDFGVNGVA